MRSKKRRHGVAAALAIAATLVAAPQTGGAVDLPVVTSSATSAQTGDSVTLTLTGCAGSEASIVAIYDTVAEAPEENPIAVDSIGSGTWQAIFEIPTVGDVVFVGRCASGARSAPVRVDLQWLEAFPDPVSGDGPLRGVRGTDCDPPQDLVVRFWTGERIFERRPVPDAGGDWYQSTPPIPSEYGVVVTAVCGTASPNYIPFAHQTSPGAALPERAHGWWSSPGDGTPGTAYRAGFAGAASDKRIVRTRPGRDEVVEVAVEGAGERWRFSAVAGGVDDRYTLTCNGRRSSFRFDVELPALRLEPADASAARAVVGTDCPAGSVAAVRIATGADVDERSAAIDVFGDWRVELPAVDERAGATVTASCGSVSYEPIAYGPGPPAAPGPASGPGPASPAAAVPAEPAYTG